MSTKHTPGPWSVHPDDDSCECRQCASCDGAGWCEDLFYASGERAEAGECPACEGTGVQVRARGGRAAIAACEVQS